MSPFFLVRKSHSKMNKELHKTKTLLRSLCAHFKFSLYKWIKRNSIFEYFEQPIIPKFTQKRFRGNLCIFSNQLLKIALKKFCLRSFWKERTLIFHPHSRIQNQRGDPSKRVQNVILDQFTPSLCSTRHFTILGVKLSKLSFRKEIKVKKKSLPLVHNHYIPA